LTVLIGAAIQHMIAPLQDRHFFLEEKY
jgi:hypothetical protein